MQNPVFIAGDWGNSNLRLYLCEMTDSGSAALLDSRTGPGVQQIENDFDTVIFSLCGDWLEQHGNIAVILSGAVGSNIGWRSTPYLSCPVDAAEITASCVQFVVRGISFSLLSGVKTRNPLDAADVMRGEELQLLGWLQQEKSTKRGERLLVLPGTHNKWLLVTD
ncbi:MAG: 2-dehydro-3-deoxygalactonokinase, partial [Arenicella sp.]|nr:2-dehydro-3-deoxygalactonokinase [Arenicella sp.]